MPEMGMEKGFVTMYSCFAPSFLLFGKLKFATQSAVVLALLIGSHSNAHADILLYANTQTQMGTYTPPSTGTSGTVYHTRGGELPEFSLAALGRASATFGQLKFYAEASAGVNNGAAVYCVNTAYFQDDFLFNATGLAGTSGTVEMKFTVDGTLFATRSANTPGYLYGYDAGVIARAKVELGTSGDPNEWFEKNQNVNGLGEINQTSGTIFLGIEQTVLVPFTFGTTLENVRLTITGGGNAIGGYPFNFSSSIFADLEHTANWGGFGAVRDANGNLVTDYSFSSGSGFDYTQPVTSVPEPGSAALSVLCIGCVLARRHRTKR